MIHNNKKGKSFHQSDSKSLGSITIFFRRLSLSLCLVNISYPHLTSYFIFTLFLYPTFFLNPKILDNYVEHRI